MTASIAPQMPVAKPMPMRRADSRQRFALAADARLRFVLTLFVLLGALLLARIGQIALMGWINGPDDAPVTVMDRADIVDRNGVPLARTIPVHAIRVVRSQLMHDPRALATALAGIFPDTSAEIFYHRMTDRPSAMLRRRATPAQLNAVNDLAEIGFDYPEEPERLYPQGSLAAHVLGFVAPGRGGTMGIERRFETELASGGAGGPAGGNGAPLALSIDTRVQASLELELSDAVTQLQAKGGAGLVLDVDTGEVVAMASNPTFDPNNVRFSSPEAQWNSVSFTTYELGSTFKPITIAAAMDAGVVTDMARRYDATQPLHIGTHTISDSHPAHRWLNVPEALVHSSNVVTAQIADQLGKARLQSTFRSLEFDRRPRIELGERGRPLWPAEWGRTTTMTAGYGHSIQVTPLHLASAYAALVNGGVWRPATILKVEPGDAPAGRRVFTEATSAKMRQLLRMIVASGTGNRADAPGYRVGGKTGSAERVIDGAYVGNSVTATFAGVFPMDHPRYVVLVMIDRPPGNAYSLGQRTAGFTAAPVVRKVVQRIGPMLGIYPDA
ncbi:MAG: peptidoglycan D,D-transpeptidase FtsI family protein, partial [Sphingopyxis sp.]